MHLCDEIKKGTGITEVGEFRGKLTSCSMARVTSEGETLGKQVMKISHFQDY